MDEEDGFFKEEICTLTPDELFDAFLQSCDLAETLDVFRKLCQSVDVNPRNHKTLYASLKSKLTSWKCKSLWTKLDKRAEQKDYKNKPCVKNKVLVIGAGPCGLRVAIEAALLGAYVVVIEKRDRFSRNNVLHLWPFLIVDLKNLGAKKFFGQFCAGAIDHISIRRLQLILLKVSLILGVQVYPKCGFIKLVEPTDAHGWRGAFDPPSHTLNKFDFDIIVGADGRRAALKGFKGKEFRGKLAIGITVNFQNRNTKEEARVEEISGVAFIFNQQFFQDLKDSTGIDLENIVYYKDETHYFVMCAKKKSLLQKGVLKKDFQDAYDLLQTNNVNHDKLLAYAREAANFSTNNQLPNLDFALNHYHKEDVAMFDFTSLYHSEHAAKIYERRGRRLLATVVGDSLLEPFWPTGSGCARGFLGCFDAAWIMKGWGQGQEPLDLLAERDSIFRLLAQTTPENISKNYEEFSINPATRYPNLNKSSVSQNRVKHLFDNKPGPIDQDDGPEPMDTSKDVSSVEGGVNARMLLKWCQEQTRKYKNVKINDMSTSWRSGLGFCAIIHRYRPDLIDYASLSPKDHLTNLQLAFNVAEEHLGIPPQMSASEMVMKDVPDTLMIVSYVSQYHEVFKNETPVAAEGKKLAPEQHEFRAKSPLSKLSVLTRVSRRTHKEKRRSEEALDIVPKRKRPAVSKENEENVVPMDTSPPCKVSSQGPAVTTGKASNRISALAEQVFGPGGGNKSNVPSVRDSSEMCFFCKRRVYLMERLSAEGHFFHRECFLCENCGCTLRLGSYSYIPPTSPGEKGHFLCHLHYDQLLYKMQEEPVDEVQVPGKGRPRLTKSKSAAPNTFFKNVEVTIQPDDKEAVSFEPKPECDNAKINGFHDGQEILGREDNDGSRVKHERSNSFGKYKRLEARPLRRSSIASVRKSDKTVRDKGVGYTFSDGVVDDRDAKRDGRPLQMPLRNGTRKAVEFERPSTPGSSTGTPVKEVTVDINMEEPLADERKKKREEERKSVIDAVKTAAAGKSWLKKQDAQEGMVQKLGTLERRKAKSRRAMYPPLSTYFNPEDKETQDALEGISQITRGQQHMHVKMVDISLEDDNPSSTGNKAVDQGKTRPKTVSIATANEPTSPPRPSTSPTSPTSPSYYKPGKVPGRSLVAARAARLTNLIANDFRPLPVKDKWEEKEERKNVSAVTSGPSDKSAREEQAAPAGSPSAQRRSLPRVPAEEPFHSTKETTKIVQQKQKGRKGFHFGKGKKQDKKTDKEAEDMGFVVVDLNDGLSTPEKEAIRKQEEEELFSESSEDDLLDENSPKLQRSNARRFGKPRRNTESPDDKLKKREQAKIRSAMKQRESKRLRMAQSIQRELEETAVKQADLEREGVVVEKALRSGGDTGAEEQQLMLQWFKLVNRKNALIRYESELVIHANSIQLEDQQGRLEGEIRELLMKEHPSKQDNRIVQQKTKQLVDIVEQRNQLVELLDEERKREQEEDRLFDSILAAKGFITTV